MGDDSDMPYPPGAVLKRKMGIGDYWHYGVASEYYHPDSKEQMIYQFGGPYEGVAERGLRALNLVWPSRTEQAHTGVHIGLTPHTVFSEGRQVVVETVPENPIPVLQRAKEMMNRADYNPVMRNCEHYANYALSGAWESEQAQSAIGKAMQAAGLLLISGIFGG